MTTNPIDPSQYVVGPDATIEDVDLDSTEVRLRDGRRLTNELAEQLAEETLQRAGRTGRPSLTGRAAHSPQLGLRVTPELHRRLQARAEREGKRASQVVRDALEHWV